MRGADAEGMSWCTCDHLNAKPPKRGGMWHGQRLVSGRAKNPNLLHISQRSCQELMEGGEARDD